MDEARWLMLHGVDPDARDQPHGDTALHYAALEGDEEAVLLFLAAGADPNRANNYGYTPLHWAAELGRVKVARTLLDASAHHGRKNDYGETALDVAKLNNRQPCVDALAAHGALNPTLAPLSAPMEQTSKRIKSMVRPTPLDMRRFCPVRDLHPMMWQHLSDLDREMIRCAQNSSRSLPVADEAFVRTCIKEGNTALLQMALEW